MKHKFLISIFLLVSKLSFGQNCNCDSLFLQTKQIVEENYAGWFDKVKPENKNFYTEWTSSKYSEARTLNNDSICAKKLQEWVSYFKDKHLRIRFTKPKAINSATKISADKIEILTTSLTETQINAYFTKSNALDPIEGIYINPNYKLAITKVKPNLFHATILTTQNENWKPGEVKLVITKNNNQYSGVFYEGDKSDISNHTVKLVDNILDFDIVFFEKIAPTAKIKRDITEYEMGKDKYAPSLKIENDVAIWKFPSFENNAAEQTAYLLNKYKDKLNTTPYWVLDLTDNSGGDYKIGMQLIQYIYANPILKYNIQRRMTSTNLELWYNTFVKPIYEELDEKSKKKLDADLELKKSKIGTMYNQSGKMADTLTLGDVLPYPKKIALLVNENTASSGELFTMLARQSSKVKVFGSNTLGMMDYGNIVQYKTNHPTIRVQVPIDRYLWLDTGFSIDKEGLKPDIYLKGNNWIKQSVEVIKK